MKAPAYLLDTHVVLWLDSAPRRVSAHVRIQLNQGTCLYYSAASAWETAIKRVTGKLRLVEPFSVIAAQLQLVELSVTAHHGEIAGALPLHHRDPFDRVMVAQAQTEELTLVTTDRHLKRYGLEILLV